ncbi:MAG: carboxylate--amine ligase, partial [Eggerthellaceae bacterium]|nr:carboxylate--amine ligase [Eggerthellaceae bacterium]
MGNNAAYTKEFIDIVSSLNGDIPGRKAAQSYMQNSTAIVHDKHVPSSYLPRFFDQRTYDTFKRVSETTYSIAAKIMQHYLDDPSYRSLFDFDERIVELILLPRGYPDILPFARIDVFLDEETYRCGFCELNADGSSGLNEDREQNASFEGSPALKLFAQNHTLATSELFDTWVDEFLAIYGRYERKVDNPQIAIVDFLGPSAITAEFEEFCRRFSKRGVVCFISDVRDLRYEGQWLHTVDGKRVDAVFRRCVTSDILDHWDESLPLINAVRDEKVALIGSFAGHIPHDKQIFDAMHHPLTQAFLTDE